MKQPQSKSAFECIGWLKSCFKAKNCETPLSFSEKRVKPALWSLFAWIHFARLMVSHQLVLITLMSVRGLFGFDV